MQEIHNNYFGWKKCSTILLQAKAGKYKRRNVRATLLLHFGTRAYLSSHEAGSCYVFSTQNNCCEFLASDGVIFQSVFKPFSKTPVFGAALTSRAFLF